MYPVPHGLYQRKRTNYPLPRNLQTKVAAGFKAQWRLEKGYEEEYGFFSLCMISFLRRALSMIRLR